MHVGTGAPSGSPNRLAGMDEQMISRSRMTVLVALAALSAVSVFAAADITGKWTAAFDTQIGEQKYTYTFRVKGSELTGTAASELGTTTIRNGKIDGDTVTFVEPLDFMGMLIEITYTGKIVSDDQIDFTRKVADIATEPLVAKRVK
jgi:hypothetical protein